MLGLGFMLMGENSHTVTWALKDKLKAIEAEPAAQRRRSKPVYDRTELVDHVIDTVRKNLFEGGLLVVAVLFAFLGNLRAALIVALAIPLSMLFAFSGMLRFGIAASLLSLGAIDFGMIVDSSVVMIENCVRHLAHDGDSAAAAGSTSIRDAAVEVRRPTMFGELIIMIVYLPILTLGRDRRQAVPADGADRDLRPGRLDDPVADADAGAGQPVSAASGSKQREPLLMRLAHAHPRSRAAISPCTTRRPCWASPPRVLVLAFGLIAPNLGSEFVPRLSEGAIAISVVRLAGTDLDESIRYNTEMERRDPGRVSRRSGTRLEPHRHGRSRHRSDGRRTDRHLHHAQAARRSGTRPARRRELTDADRQGAARPARPAAGLFAADRNADERNGLRRAGRSGREALRRRSRRAGDQSATRSNAICSRSPAAPT